MGTGPEPAGASTAPHPAGVAASTVPAGEAPPRPGWVIWTGLAVVLAAAAVLSFDALRGLALAVAIPAHFAWLLPVAVDAGAAVSCATWLGGRTAPDAARYAGRMTWCLLLVTVVGNAAQLGMHAAGIVPPWWVAVAVGSIPPTIVGSTVHLVVLLVRRSDRAEAGPTAVRPDQTTETALAVVDPVDEDGADELLPAVRAWMREQTGTPSQRQLRTEFGVGANRARRLMEAA